MRSILVGLVAVIITPMLALVPVFARLFRVPDRDGGIYDKIPYWWSHVLLAVSGVRVRVHDAERIAPGEPRVFVCNHVSWYDVFAAAATLPRGKYVAKSELFKIPVLGIGMRAAGMIEIERQNRKAAFAAYEIAAKRIREGTPVVVFPEGTRGRTYELRPFKKGPFVLAIAAGVPIVPMVVHGTLEIMRKGSWRINPGVIDVHFLDSVPTAGYGYDDRDEVAATVHVRMEELLRSGYGVRPTATQPVSEGVATDGL